MDGFDVVLETPTLGHLRDAFERVQRQLGPLISPPGGPVIFSGEANCWPFPHPWKKPPFLSGDYRPNYVYHYGDGRKKLRGNQVCQYWRKRWGKSTWSSEGGRNESRPVHLPFPNSGVFIGRVSSLRRLYDLAAETLTKFGDFADQALVFTMALHADASARPWVPLHIDTTGEIFASLHGTDMDAIAANLRSAKVCNLREKVDFGFYSSSISLEMPSRWSLASRGQSLRRDRVPPLVAHFNGDKKGYYEENCYDSTIEEATLTGLSSGVCNMIDFGSQTEMFFTALSGQETSVHYRSVTLPMPPPGWPTSAQVLGSAFTASTLHEVRDMMLFRPGAATRMLVQNLVPSTSRSIRMVRQNTGTPCSSIFHSGRMGAGSSCSSSSGSGSTVDALGCTGAPLHWLEGEPFRNDEFGRRRVEQPLWRRLEPVRPSEGTGRSLDAIFVDRNVTFCGRNSRSRRSINSYCRLLFSISTSWQCLAPSGPTSAGLLIAEFATHNDLRLSIRESDLKENIQSLSQRQLYDDAISVEAAMESVTSLCGDGLDGNQKWPGEVSGLAAPCPGQAVVDFVALLPRWQATSYRWMHRDKSGMVLAVKDPLADQ
ncbi:unnamed protein product [Polarella glacialis]|nr:unnamed protein product [Polarella glacialis]